MANRDILGRFIKGCSTWNKGKSIQLNTGRTHFKKGNHPKTEFRKGQIAPNKGRKFPHLCGENSSNWKGGITPLRIAIQSTFEYRQWRSDVFTRDNFTCQKCNQIGGNLEAHHKISFNSLLRKHEITNVRDALRCIELWNINNGLTLCEKCHEQTDNYGPRPKVEQKWQQ